MDIELLEKINKQSLRILTSVQSFSTEHGVLQICAMHAQTKFIGFLHSTWATGKQMGNVVI